MTETMTATSAAARPSRARRAVHPLPWLAILGVYLFLPEFLSLGTQILIMVLFTLSLFVVLGYGGIVTMGHALFFGIGAYGAGLFALHVSSDPLLGLLAATVLAGLFGLVIGAMIVHTQGLTMLVLTLAFAALFGEMANQMGWLTGGDDGLQGYWIDPILGVFEFDLWGRVAYLYAAVVLLVWFVLTAIFIGSPFGRSVLGIRRNATRMRAIGTPVWWRLLMTYAIAAAMAGSAGAIAAQTTGVVGLDSFGMLLSGTAVVMLILGGVHSIYGAFVGAVVYGIVHDYAAQIDPYYWMMVVGLLLMAVVYFFDEGLTSLAGRVAAALRRKETRR